MAMVLGTGSYLPHHVVANDEVGGPAGVDDEWIVSKTGIRTRHFAAPEEATSDLAAEAAQRAIADGGLEPSQISLVVVATSTPDHLQPPTAALVQERVGAVEAAAFDLNAVCSGFVFALSVVDRMVRGTGRSALVIGGDIYSRILDRRDRRTTILFGDGAGAALIGHDDDHRREILATSLHTFGELNDTIIVPAGGSRLPLHDAHRETGEAYFQMRGREVRSFVIQEMPPLIADFLGEHGFKPGDVDHFVPHQANGMMLAELAPAAGLERARLHQTVETYGNTGAASVGITLDVAARSGEIKEGDIVLLAGFGGGMAAGLALIRW